VSTDFAQLSRLLLADHVKWLLNLLTNVVVNPLFVNHDQLQNANHVKSCCVPALIKKLDVQSLNVNPIPAVNQKKKKGSSTAMKD
jgi:hypothetical protein